MIDSEEQLQEWLMFLLRDSNISVRLRGIIAGLATCVDHNDDWEYVIYRQDAADKIGIPRPSFYQNWAPILETGYVRVVREQKVLAGNRAVSVPVVVLDYPA